MKRVEAGEILKSLVEGRDPISGEELPSESVLQKAPVLRALLLAQSEIAESVKREKRRAQVPARAREPWTDEEDLKLMADFQRGLTIADLAATHGRTMNAIDARLERLGLLPAESSVSPRRSHASARKSAEETPDPNPSREHVEHAGSAPQATDQE